MSNDKKTDLKMQANDIISAFPTHPGEILKDEINIVVFLNVSWRMRWV